MLPDAINFARKISLRKLWNIILVELSYTIAILLKKPVLWGRPWFVSIETSSVCNLSCPQCPTGAGDISRSSKFMSPDDYRSLLGQLSKTTAILSLYFQGEPLMQKEFHEYIHLANKQRIYTQTSTNGQLLTEDVCRGLVSAGLDRIIISLDGIDQESYEAYRRGGEFQKVVDGIRNLSRIRRVQNARNPYIIVQFLVFKYNQHQIDEIRNLARESGADKVWIKSAQIEYTDSADDFIPNRYSRYFKSPSGEWKLKGRLRNRCKRLWQTTVITSDTIVVPCCFDKHASFPMGNTGEKDIAQIWNGAEYQQFRSRIFSERKEVAICVNCTE